MNNLVTWAAFIVVAVLLAVGIVTLGNWIEENWDQIVAVLIVAILIIALVFWTQNNNRGGRL